MLTIMFTASRCFIYITLQPIPDEFLKRRYISDEELNRRKATFVIPSTPTNFWHINLEKDGSNVFFAGDWSKFLEFYGITRGETLLIKYHGNMIFTIEVFGFTGCQKKLEKQGIRFLQTGNREGNNSSLQPDPREEANLSQQNAHGE
jgi:hypothetical protein